MCVPNSNQSYCFQCNIQPVSAYLFQHAFFCIPASEEIGSYTSDSRVAEHLTFWLSTSTNPGSITINTGCIVKLYQEPLEAIVLTASASLNTHTTRFVYSAAIFLCTCHPLPSIFLLPHLIPWKAQSLNVGLVPAHNNIHTQTTLHISMSLEVSSITACTSPSLPFHLTSVLLRLHTYPP